MSGNSSRLQMLTDGTSRVETAWVGRARRADLNLPASAMEALLVLPSVKANYEPQSNALAISNRRHSEAVVNPQSTAPLSSGLCA